VWDPPVNDGGCAVQDYAVYRDADGTGTVWTEVNPVASYTRNDPFNREFACTIFPTGSTAGDVFSFYIKAINVQTSGNSGESAPYLLASIPATPANAPSVVTSMTDGTQVSVAYDAVTSNGGSAIISYELQMGSLSLNDFITISGNEPKSLALSFTITKNINKGSFYAFRYRAINSVGFSKWSPVGRIQAATTPLAPATPIYVSATNQTITLSLTNTFDNGGSQITQTKLFRDSGNRTSDINIEIVAYAGESSYTVTGLIPLTTYRFAYVATNSFGDSAQSNPITIETSTRPLQLAAPQVDWTQSDKTSLYISWATVPDPDATIRGYILSMDDGKGGAFSDIFSGIFEPSTLSFLKTGLTTGNNYRFKVRAAGYNEEGPDSNIASFYSCTSPSGFNSPTAVLQTSTSIQIQWKAPLDNGGCSLSGYAVFKDDEFGITTEVNSAFDPLVRNNPSLDGVIITNFAPLNADVGKTFKIKVTAYNNGGRQADSGGLALVLASIPSTPTVGPVNTVAVTSSTKIAVTYGVTSPPSNGGSPILSYALEIDDGRGGSFQKLVGFSSNSLLTAFTVSSGIEKGLEYRLRYRVKNAIGWSNYSPISFILAANIPNAPTKPTFSSFSVDTLLLDIQPSKDNGGSPIKFYHLYRYNTLTSTFDLLFTTTPSSLVYSAVSGTNGYTVGSTYRFRVVVENSIGTSQPSDDAYIAFGDVPPQPTAINPTDCTTTRNTIKVKWNAVSAPLSVTGYILNMDDGRLGEYTQVYIGTNRPDLTEYTVSGLTTGLPYRFTIQATNSNGNSLASVSTTLYACDIPAGLAAPEYLSSDKTLLTISLSWNSPIDDGGCPITGFEVYVDNGSTGIPTTKVLSVADNDPSINSATVTFIDPDPNGPGTIVGALYTFSVRSINQAGYIESQTTKIALASLPSKPITAPQSDTTVTNTQKLKVLIAVFDNTLSGGSPITRYEVQIDDGNNGKFTSIFTLSPSLTFVSGISRGEKYRVRYRAENANGWGEFSDTSLLKAATVPNKPPAPIYDPNASDSTKIYLGFVPPSDNGGAEISQYRLYMDAVASTSNPVLIHNGTNLFYEVGAVLHSLTLGTTYRFYLVAENEFGLSQNSEETRAALGSYPNQPNSPSKVESESTLTSITIAWDVVVDVYSTPISGYYLYGDGGSGGSLSLIYDGSTKPNTLKYKLEGLTTGIAYRFAISALNINGESATSNSIEIFACLKPVQFSAPTLISSSKTSVSIAWTEPVDNG